MGFDIHDWVEGPEGHPNKTLWDHLLCRLYRYEASYTAFGFGIQIYEFEVIKQTPKGVWIDVYGKKKLVILHHRKKFAYRTKRRALESFIARKKKQIEIVKGQLQRAEEALLLAEKHRTHPDLEEHVV